MHHFTTCTACFARIRSLFLSYQVRFAHIFNFVRGVSFACVSGNSVVAKLATNIKLNLLSSRVTIKKCTALHMGRDERDMLMKRCADVYKSAVPMSKDKSRWDYVDVGKYNILESESYAPP